MASSREAEFWEWFAQHGDKIKSAKGFKAKWLVKQIGKQFTKAFPNLVWQCGPGIDGVWTFEVSADGLAEYVPEVIRVVDAAPKIPGWEILKFRQPAQLGDFKFRGAVLSAATVRYSAQWSGEKADVQLFLPGYSRATDDQLVWASFLLLDCLLGEYTVLTRIQSIEFLPIDRAPAESQALMNLRWEIETQGVTPEHG